MIGPNIESFSISKDNSENLLDESSEVEEACELDVNDCEDAVINDLTAIKRFIQNNLPEGKNRDLAITHINGAMAHIGLEEQNEYRNAVCELGSNYVGCDVDKDDLATVWFQLQNGCRDEVGENGTQLDTLLHFYLSVLRDFNENHPCEENYKTIKLVKRAILQQESRRSDREIRGVEGTINN